MITDQSRDIISFECDGCKKTLTSKLNFDRHISSCILLKDKEHKLLQETLANEKMESQAEIKNLKKQLENSRLDMIAVSIKLKEVEKQLDKQERLNKHLQDSLLEKATSKTNNTTNNIDLKLFISEEVVSQKIQNKFTKNHLINGYNGIANFIKKEIVTNDDGKLLYTCSDASRQIFNYTDENGNEVKDVKGAKMLSLVKPKLIEKTSQIQAKEQDEYNYLRKRYNGDDEIPSEEVQKRMNQHKFYSEIANDMIVNKIGDNKFPIKMSSELVKVLC
jgi:phosphatidylglycerophosphatase A